MLWKASRPLDPAGRVEVPNKPCQRAVSTFETINTNLDGVMCGAKKDIQNCDTYGFLR